MSTRCTKTVRRGSMALDMIQPIRSRAHRRWPVCRMKHCPAGRSTTGIRVRVSRRRGRLERRYMMSRPAATAWRRLWIWVWVSRMIPLHDWLLDSRRSSSLQIHTISTRSRKYVRNLSPMPRSKSIKTKNSRSKSNWSASRRRWQRTSLGDWCTQSTLKRRRERRHWRNSLLTRRRTSWKEWRRSKSRRLLVWCQSRSRFQASRSRKVQGLKMKSFQWPSTQTSKSKAVAENRTTLLKPHNQPLAVNRSRVCWREEAPPGSTGGKMSIK